MIYCLLIIDRINVFDIPTISSAEFPFETRYNYLSDRIDPDNPFLISANERIPTSLFKVF